LFVVSTYLSLLLGHSVGMHRKLIHRTYDCSKPLERFLVYLGVIVGMAGPFGLIRVHDIRDWAQREPRCHNFFAHRERPTDFSSGPGFCNSFRSGRRCSHWAAGRGSYGAYSGACSSVWRGTGRSRI
jgi:fatty-acid desaturase